MLTMRGRNLILVLAMLVASAAAGQTATPTNTPANTSTPTSTPTPTLVFRGGTGFEDVGIPELTVNGACTRVTTGCRTGNGCYQMNPSGAVCNVAVTGLASGEKRGSVVVKGTTWATNTNLIVHEATGGVVIIRRLPSGTVRALTGATEGGSLTTCATTAATLDAGVATRIDFRVVPESAPAAGDGTIDFRLVNAETQAVIEAETCASATTGTGEQTIRLGSTVAATTDVTFDDFFVADTAVWPGDVRWVPVRPSADGTCSASILTKADQASGRYAWVNEVPHDSEGTYIYNANPTPASCSFTHPAGSTYTPPLSNPVYATRLSSFCKQTAGSPQQTVTLLLGDSAGTPANLTTSIVAQQRTTIRNPNDSAPWTVTNVNALPFGVTLSGTQLGSHALCSALQWNVAFVAGTPTPTVAPTNTNTPASTSTATRTNTPANTATQTPTVTNTPVNTATRTNTPTLTPRPAFTAAATFTPTPTRTNTPASTNTPVPANTNTPASTATVTQTWTPTPIGRSLALAATCASPPCETASFSARGGTTSVTVEKTAGTGTWKVFCRPVYGVAASEVQKGSDLSDDGTVEFTSYCEQVFVRTTACSSCAFNVFGRTTSQDVQWAP